MDFKKPTEKEYFEGRTENRLYIYKPFFEHFTGIKKRFAYIKISGNDNQVKFMKIKNEVVLSESGGNARKYQLKAVIIEDSREIESLIVQTFTKGTGSPHKDSYSFNGLEIENLYKFLKGIKELSLPTTESLKIGIENLEEVLANQKQAFEIIKGNEDLVAEVLKNDITKSDIVALAYRKNQLKKFQNLLEDDEYFKNEIDQSDNKTIESVWQSFFEKNTWIFGYGLNYIFNSPLCTLPARRNRNLV